MGHLHAAHREELLDRITTRQQCSPLASGPTKLGSERDDVCWHFHAHHHRLGDMVESEDAEDARKGGKGGRSAEHKFT